jgi:hypothetical protein
MELSITDAWRQLRNEGVTTVSYETVRQWCAKLNIQTIQYDPNPQHDTLGLLRRYARLREAAGRKSQIDIRSEAKLAAIKILQQQPGEVVLGSRVIEIAVLCGARSRAALYDAGLKAKTLYSKQQAKNFILGVSNEQRSVS